MRSRNFAAALARNCYISRPRILRTFLSCTGYTELDSTRYSHAGRAISIDGIDSRDSKQESITTFRRDRANSFRESRFYTYRKIAVYYYANLVYTVMLRFTNHELLNKRFQGVSLWNLVILLKLPFMRNHLKAMLSFSFSFHCMKETTFFFNRSSGYV